MVYRYGGREGCGEEDISCGGENLEMKGGRVGEGRLKKETPLSISPEGGRFDVGVAGEVAFDGLPEAAKRVPPNVGQESGEGFAQRVFSGKRRGIRAGGEADGFGDTHEDFGVPVRTRKGVDRGGDFEREGVPRAGMFPDRVSIYSHLTMVADGVEAKPNALFGRPRGNRQGGAVPNWARKGWRNAVFFPGGGDREGAPGCFVR